MGGKGKKKKNSISNGGGGGAGGDKKKGKKSSGKGKRSGKSKGSCNVDIFTEAAMDNAYYICHNVQDVLKIRGFPWPEAKKKKGKKK